MTCILVSLSREGGSDRCGQPAVVGWRDAAYVDQAPAAFNPAHHGWPTGAKPSGTRFRQRDRPARQRPARRPASAYCTGRFDDPDAFRGDRVDQSLTPREQLGRVGV
jgi:hypothetical protein